MEGLSLNISSTQGDQSLGRAKELAARLERAEADSGEKTKVAEEFSALLGTMLVILVIGMLVDGLLNRQQRARDAFAKRFARFAGKGNRAAFKSLFSEIKSSESLA